MKSKKLRSGFTTGACAAAASKAAAMLLLGLGLKDDTVDIPFPDGARHSFKIDSFGETEDGRGFYATVIKNAGDDPDVTNGAVIGAEARMIFDSASRVVVRGGRGVGRITKPGLPRPVGAPAINPVPLKMIEEAVAEALSGNAEASVETTIFIPDGESLAQKTLNARLGIEGGISILGTTGIVRPLSAEAWTATVKASMDVAKAVGIAEIVLSTGRTSERAHMKRFAFPSESYVMMGDYLEYSVGEAKRHGFRRLHLCAQWAKMLKIAMSVPQTHVRHGALYGDAASDFIRSLCGEVLPEGHDFNTAREIFDYLSGGDEGVKNDVFTRLCAAASDYVSNIASGMPTEVHLVSYEGDIVMSV